jgi:plasmid maintenance system antidote protein VapI
MKTNLKKYLMEKGKSYRQLAKDIEYHHIYINSIINGARPGAELAFKITRWSNGAITLADLRPDLCGDKPA